MAHRRAVIRLLAATLGVVVIAVLARPAPQVNQPLEVLVPEDHRVLSMPIDERVPRLEPGDTIDLYLRTNVFASSDTSVDVLAEPGVVTTVDESSFSVAVPEQHVGAIAGALSEGDVLVVRR